MSAPLPIATRTPREGWLIWIAAVSGAFFLLFPAYGIVARQQARARGEQVVEVSANELGGFLPSRLEVRAGQTLQATFFAMDVAHSFEVPQLGIDVELPVGEERSVSLATAFEQDAQEFRYAVNGRRFRFAKGAGATSPPPLVLEFRCNRYCSPQHWGMRGTVTVLPP